MDYRQFGNTGLRVSPVCLGTMGIGDSSWRDWVVGAEEARPLLKRALDLGVNFFDMANFYSLGENERVVGRELLSMARRDDLVLASKVYYAMSDAPNDQGLSRKHIMSSIDATLSRLGTDYLDLYLIHAFDPRTPIEETMRALDDVVRAGKARYIGASTMCAWQFAKMNAVAEKNGWTTFANMQCQYNLLYREEEREMMPYCQAEGVAVTTFSPLARGYLTGAIDARMRSDAFTTDFYGDEIDVIIAQRVADLAVERGVTPAEIAMAWVAASPHVTAPLLGAQTPAQLDVAVGAALMTLTDEEKAFLEDPYRPRDLINDHNPVYRRRSAPYAPPPTPAPAPALTLVG